MTTYTVKKEVRRIGLLRSAREAAIYWIVRDDGTSVASTADAAEAEEIRAAFEADDAEYQKKMAAAGVPEWQFLDENSHG